MYANLESQEVELILSPMNAEIVFPIGVEIYNKIAIQTITNERTKLFLIYLNTYNKGTSITLIKSLTMRPTTQIQQLKLISDYSFLLYLYLSCNIQAPK